MRSAITWKYVGSAVPAANTVAGVLDALYTLGTSATYYDGSARTPGAGQAGTWSRYQNGGVTEAVYYTPVSDPHTVRHIFAGQASGGTKTPTMASPDTSATVTILYGLNRSSGAFNAWDNASPFTSGSFTGYSRCCALGTFTLAKVHLYECSVGHAVAFATTTAMTHCIAGDLIDAGTDSATSPNSAEVTTDGRYVILVNGGTSATSNAFWSLSSTTANPINHNTGANTSCHAYVLSPGGVTLSAILNTFLASTAITTTLQVNADGDAAFRQMVDFRSGGTWIGRLREIAVGPDAKLGQTASAGATVKAYAFSTGPSTDSDTLWLLA